MSSIYHPLERFYTSTSLRGVTLQQIASF